MFCIFTFNTGVNVVNNGYCQVLPSFELGDCLCCREIPEVIREADDNDTVCISAFIIQGSPISAEHRPTHLTQPWKNGEQGQGHFMTGTMSTG